MADSFVERMRYLLSEMSVVGEGFIQENPMIQKLAVILDKFQATLGNQLHDDVIRKLEDKSEALSWMKELEEVTYGMEDAVGKWRVNSVELDERFVRVRSKGRLALAAQCFFPAFRWAFASLDASEGLTVIASAMETHVEAHLLKGKKLMDKIAKLKSSSTQDLDPRLVPSVREDARISVLKHLLSPDLGNGSTPVVSIVGFGGSGKTTLARSLFNDDSVKAYFQVRVWVHVEADFSDDRKMAIKLLDSLLVQYSEEAELESLFHLLQDSFSGKTVLAVFDDVWDDGSKSWETLINKLFESSEVGKSRILVTTRSDVASGTVHNLAPLLTADCRLILKSSVNAESLHRTVKERLVKRCEGSPLVAKILGRKLQTKDSVAREVFMEEICMVRFPKLYRTYDNLLPYMKACLLCCANLPKSSVLDSEKIITLWMSQGYLGYHSAASNCSYKLLPYLDVERKGFECLSRLIHHSFFQEIASQSIHKLSSHIRLMCKMPDDVHDFVTYMIQAHDNGRRSFSPKIPVNLKFDRITALILSSCQVEEVPGEVEFMSRLQYLDLSDNPLKQLPPTMCRLFYLEFLDVHFCYLLSCLPDNIEKLQQMRHLRMNHTTEELHYLPEGFGNLTLMRTLDVFRVGGKYKEAASMLMLLAGLVDICIVVHGEVNLPDACLDIKLFLVNLELSFVGEGRDQKIAASIEDMEPPPNLEMLKFEHYPRLKLPRWILFDSLIENLKRLSIKSAANICSLPALWKLSSLEFLWLYDIPNLKHLGCEFFGLTSTSQQYDSPGSSSQYMSYSDEETTSEDAMQDAERDFIEELMNDHSEEITVEDSFQDAEREEATTFCSLKTLRIEYLDNWETWEDANYEDDEFNIKVMPCLEELFIAHCPKLQGWPLYILRDTPWYKDSYPMEAKNTGEEEHDTDDRNVKLPSPEYSSSATPADDKNKLQGTNVASKAAYINLRKFVRDAYMAKAPAQHLKVSIPEGVLGMKAETSYLQLDYLHDWFEKDRSIFAEQMCVWSKHIYELMTPSDKERVQMASYALTSTVGRQEHSSRRAENLVDFMMENKAKIYLVPFLRPGHWELLAIVPENETVYRFDSLQENISPELTRFLNMVGRKYATRGLNSAVAHNSWKVVDIKHKIQVDYWECGYYVMIWMDKIAREIQDLNLETHFPVDISSYEPGKLTEVDWKWCAHVMPKFVA